VRGELTLSEKDVNGRAGVVGGKVIITNPQGDGKPAVLYPAGEGLTVFVNDKLVETPLEVFEDDIIEITPQVLTEEARCVAKISADAYTAELTISPQTVTQYLLMDTEMSDMLKFQTKKEIRKEKTVTLEEADAVLKDKNIVFGIDFALLKGVVDRASAEPEVVAEGKKLREGANGRVEFLVSTEVETIVYDDSSQKNVDLRERYRFPVVKEGDRIAKVHPSIEGVAGQLVTGRIIAPRPVKDAKFKCGEGADFLEERGEIVATRDGRLVISGSTIKVVDLITHNGDVNLESGNIHFNGDVRIYGNILENMLVDAKGSLLVEGSGYSAVIKAGKGIQVTKNLIKCQVEGGLFFALLQEIIMQVDTLEKEYSTFLKALKQIVTSLAKKGRELGKNLLLRITRAVLNKMPGNMLELPALIQSSLKGDENRQFDSLRKTMELVSGLFGGTLQIDNMETLDNIGSSLRAFLAKGENLLKEVPPLGVSYVQNSNLYHMGDINIVGAGMYYSCLSAGGNVTVDGVCRGGTIQAGGDVKVKEFLIIASENVATTSHIRIRVPEQSSIYFDQVHEDVTVQVGKLVYRFDQSYSKVKIGYDPESGMLKLTNF